MAYLELSNLLDQRYSPFGIISRNVRGAEEEVERIPHARSPTNAARGAEGP